MTSSLPRFVRPAVAAAALVALAGCPVPHFETGETGFQQTTYTALDGTLGYHSASATKVVCDVDLSIVGTNSDYVGTCANCDFVLDVTGSVKNDTSPGDCTLDPVYSLVPTADVYDFRLFHQSFTGYFFDTSGGYYVYTPYNGEAMWLEYTRETREGPQRYTVVLADASNPNFRYGATSIQGTTLTWAWFSSPEVSYYNYAFYSACPGMEPWTEPDDPATTLTDVEVLPVDGFAGDLWEVEVTEGQPELRLSVDTIASNTEFQPRMVINGPDGCTWTTAYDNFDCTPTGSRERCAAWHAPNPPAGTWSVAVLNDHTLAESHNSYRIGADGAAKLVRVAEYDDYEAWRWEHPLTLETSLIATLTAAP